MSLKARECYEFILEKSSFKHDELEKVLKQNRKIHHELYDILKVFEFLRLVKNIDGEYTTLILRAEEIEYIFDEASVTAYAQLQFNKDKTALNEKSKNDQISRLRDKKETKFEKMPKTLDTDLKNLSMSPPGQRQDFSEITSEISEYVIPKKILKTNSQKDLKRNIPKLELENSNAILHEQDFNIFICYVEMICDWIQKTRIQANFLQTALLDSPQIIREFSLYLNFIKDKLISFESFRQALRVNASDSLQVAQIKLAFRNMGINFLENYAMQQILSQKRFQLGQEMIKYRRELLQLFRDPYNSFV
jgi:hypothetical protein